MHRLLASDITTVRLSNRILCISAMENPQDETDMPLAIVSLGLIANVWTLNNENVPAKDDSIIARECLGLLT